MELTDIMSTDAWEKFEKDLFERFSINCTVFNAQGMAVTGKPNWCNRLCPEIKANKNSLAAICAPGNQYFMAQAEKTKKPVTAECDAGFIKIAVPISVNGDFLGTAGGCGLLPEGGEVEAFIVEKSLGMAQEEIAERCKGIQTMSPDQAEEMVAFIERKLTRFVESYYEKALAAAS
jgi:ligand-binding sensor protein